jgi:adenylate cyclase
MLPWQTVRDAVASVDPLPKRIDDQLHRLHDESEILIGWAQVGAIVFFGGLYAVSPRAFAAGMMFEPVPVTLALYALFVGGRLWLAYRRLLTAPLLTLSIVVDMVVLFGLIWSFHIQYQQPAAFYLKAPTFLYVFIIIALRALRFDPRWVLIAGGSAIAAWLFMLLYALFGDALPGAITRSYVAYMTSAMILIGAEVDKMVALAGVTLVLAFVLARARQVLTQAVQSQAAVGDLSKFFAKSLAKKILSSGDGVGAGMAERRDAAIVFFDLRGFSIFAHSMSPSELVTLLSAYHALVIPIVWRHGGVVDKFLGDGILASFGAVSPSATYAADALTAVEDVLSATCEWRTERQRDQKPAPGIGAAVASGPVLFGTIGYGDRLEYTVIGDAFNLAAKLEKHNKAEGVEALTAGETFALAQSQGFEGERELRTRRSVAGVAEAIDVVVLGTARDTSVRPEAVIGAGYPTDSTLAFPSFAQTHHRQGSTN